MNSAERSLPVDDLDPIDGPLWDSRGPKSISPEGAWKMMKLIGSWS